MITKTSLLHPEIQRKLFVAMSRSRILSAQGKPSSIYMYNAKGGLFLRVKHSRGIGGGFTFMANNASVKQAVYSALQA